MGTGLYEAALKSKKKIEEMRHSQEREIKAKSQERKIIESSKVYVENLTYERLKELFELMDSDGDGLIFPERINIESLEDTLFNQLAPFLLKFAERRNISMNLKGFITAMELHMKVRPALAKTLSPVERRALLSMDQHRSKAPCSGDHFTFMVRRSYTAHHQRTLATHGQQGTQAAR